MEKRSKTVTMQTALLGGVAIVLMVVVLLIAFRMVQRFHEDNEETDDQQEYYERICWQDNVFPLLDEAFEKGDYAQVSRINQEHRDEPGMMAYYRWEHYTFMQYYDLYETFMQYWEDAREGDGRYLYGAVAAVELAGYYTEEWFDEQSAKSGNRLTYGSMTEQERRAIREYRQAAFDMLAEVFGMDESDVRLCVKQSSDTYGISSRSCQEWLEARRGQ